MSFDIHIIGGGLAGSEAAWQLAEAGLRVRLSEMRGGGDTTPAHETDRLAEMVCSNSFRSDDAEHNAVGLLHQEMRALGSLVMRAADQHRVPAGSALAVDREAFAAEVTRAIEQHPNIDSRPRARRRPARSPDDHRHRPADRLGARRSDRRRDRRRRPRLFRRHRPHRPPRQHRHGRRLDGGALGQGRQGLHQLPARQGAVRGFRRGADRRREDPIQGLGEGHALFRRLHADRGDGRARARDACATGR